MQQQPVLINGQWRAATSSGSFRAEDPARREPTGDLYPISTWPDLCAALTAAQRAFDQLHRVTPLAIAEFLEGYATRIEACAAELVELAHWETGLPVAPRLAEVELPRTTNQLRQAAAAAREGSWARPTIDTATGIRSRLEPLGPVLIFGPNNFPLAFNPVSGGDFAAAIAAGNPVIAKGHPLHPGTTRLLAEQALAAVIAAELPPETVQLIYHLEPEDGLRAMADARLGAVAYTGSRAGGLKLKAAADAAGKPIYLEMSSVNPVLLLPGVIEQRSESLATELAGSVVMGAGQFCTNPGLILTMAGIQTDQFLDQLTTAMQAAPQSTMLGRGVCEALDSSIQALRANGAELLCGGAGGAGPAYTYQPTLLCTSGQAWLSNPHGLQQEAFGAATLVVLARDQGELFHILEQLEGGLTATIYSAADGSDEELYAGLAPLLRRKVGRLLNDKPPTGVAVSPAMNHGGPFPATGHPRFTAVGLPAAMERFTMLACYDNVRPHRLPPALQDTNPNGHTWRIINGTYTQADVK